MSNQSLGKLGEDLASDYLSKKRFSILQRNFKAGYGEIDIICQSANGVIVFIEVKTRVGDSYGEPVESITPWKLREVIKTAEFFLLRNKLDCDWRIDVIAVSLKDNQTIQELEHFENVTL